MSAKIFVGNLNFETTQDELQKLLAPIGEIEDLYLPADRATGKPRGFAFVTFSDADAAEEAIKKFDGYELGGRKLRVNPAEDRPPRAPGPPSAGAPPGGWGGKPFKSKGSRRGLRGKKRSL